jgi:hypothetical protein
VAVQVSGAVRIARQRRPGETTYMPGTILAVSVLGPFAENEALGVRSWKVTILTPHGWEELASWPTTVEDAEASARRFAP